VICSTGPGAKRMRAKLPEIGVGSVSLTFIWTMLPAGAFSSRMLNVSSSVSPLPSAMPTPSARRAIAIAGCLPRMARQRNTRWKDCAPDSAMAASEAS
jgi:hypothetical protein